MLPPSCPDPIPTSTGASAVTCHYCNLTIYITSSQSQQKKRSQTILHPWCSSKVGVAFQKVVECHYSWHQSRFRSEQVITFWWKITKTNFFSLSLWNNMHRWTMCTISAERWVLRKKMGSLLISCWLKEQRYLSIKEHTLAELNASYASKWKLSLCFFRSCSLCFPSMQLFMLTFHHWLLFSQCHAALLFMRALSFK